MTASVDEKQTERTIKDITFCATIRIPYNPKLVEKNGCIFGNYNKGAPAIQVETVGNKLYFWWNGQVDIIGTTDLMDGCIHIITCCRDTVNDRLSIYVDGKKENSKEKKVSDLKIKDDFLIGKDYRGDALKFHGDILKYHIYECAFNDKQIEQIVKEWKTPNKLYQ